MRATALILSMFLLTSINNLSAQNELVDSLRHELETAVADSAILNLNLELSKEINVLSPDEVIAYAEKAIALARDLGERRKEMEGIYQTAVGYFYKGEFHLAKAKLTKIEASGFYADDPKYLGYVYNLQGATHQELSDYKSALNYYFKGLELARETNDMNREMTILNNLGEVYAYHLDVNKGRSYYRQALAMAETLEDRISIAVVLQNLGEFSETPDSVLFYCSKAQNVFRELKYDVGIAYSGNTIGAAYIDKRLYEAALPELGEAKKIFESLGFTPGLSAVYSNLGNLFTFLQRPDSAEFYYNKSISLAEENNNRQQLVETYSDMAKTFVNTGQSEKAYTYFEKAMMAKDSLFSQDKAQQLSFAETAYDTQQKEKQLIQQELTIQRQQNTQQWVIVGSALALLLFLGIFQYLRNRQRIKAKESELALSLEKAEANKLRELDRLKSNFFANISHEFRTPLTLIQTPLQQALDENTEAKNISLSARFARGMHRNAQRLLHLVNQLLDLAKLEGGRMQLSVQEGDIAHIIRTIGYGFESMAQRKQINYQVNVKNEEVIAWFDQDKLEHILTNLLSNAFKFTSSEGWIILEAQFNKSGEVAIIVRDNGIGIAEDQLPHIFERFFTLHDSAADFTGSGIGMALTKELVELHHGKIEVESKVDQGATFKITLPINQAAFSENEFSKDKKEATVPRLTSSAFVENDTSTISNDNSTPLATLIKDERPVVQVVEDNEDLRNYIKEVLHQSYRVIASVNGRKGLEQAKEQIPDLIITDIMMPEMDGNELCRRIRKEVSTSHIPVIMLTAKAEQEEKLEGLETGADDYLTKPFDTRELLARVHNLIEQRRLLRERFAGEIIFKPKEVATTSVDETFLNQVLDAIEKNMEEETFSVVELSELVAMSRSQLHRKLKSLVNKSPNQIIREMRLQRAKELLEKKAGNASEIAFMVGFNSLAYFSKCFKDQFGVVPSEVVGGVE